MAAILAMESSFKKDRPPGRIGLFQNIAQKTFERRFRVPPLFLSCE
jgi:hypothetical protein